MPPALSSLLGRDDELRTVKSLVTGARNGSSGALLILGDPGIGKTALLDGATADQSGVQLIRCDGFEAEAALPYAGLQRLALPLLSDLDALPPRQRQALRVAWGNEDGPVPDRFLVGLAMLALFATAGSVRPVVCVVDDAHWLDSESLGVLAFVARRLQAEATVLLFAARDVEVSDIALAGIPSIRLSGLQALPAAQLLSKSLPDILDPFAAAQIATATGGNPLALIDLARDLSVRQLGDLSLSPDPVPVGRHLEAHYLREVRGTTRDVQLWLLLAAAASTGRTQLVDAAATRLGLAGDAGADAESAGFVVVRETIAFRHPLVRSAVYGAPPGADRRRIHAALAAEAAVLGLIDTEAWHAAEAALGVDEAVADRLERVADRAARRGGLVSQASLLARAADLTPAGRRRNERLLGAAEAAGAAGAAHLSRDLLDRIDPDDLDPVQCGRLIIARSDLAVFVADPGAVLRAPAAILAAAAEFHGVDPEREQKALLRAFEVVLASELDTQDTTLEDLGRRFDAGASVADGPYAVALRAVSAHILLPYADAVPLMRQAIDMLATLDDAELPAFGFIGFALSTALFDEVAGDLYLRQLARIARDAGSLRVLDTVLWVQSLFELDRGDPSAAGLYVEQVRELRRAIGYDAENVVNVAYMAWTGAPRDQVEAIAELTNAMGFAGVYTSALTALAIREIAEGRYQDAYVRFRPMIDAPFLQVTYHQLADYVEAAVRSDHADEARRGGEAIAVLADASGTAWIRGLDQRCRALLADINDAEQHYRAAVEWLSESHTPVDLGRAHLLYGEWLRRNRRRRDARTHLRAALDVFDRVNAPTFAERARTELAATGEKVGDRSLVAGVEMSPREATVAHLAAAGSTNAEIGASLFISTNTVDYHLRKVFAKLGVSSRRQLADRFRDTDTAN